MSDAESATSALRCPKRLMSLPLPASTRPRCSSWLCASAATTRALAFNTLMLGHYRSPTARSTAPFRCSCCHSLPISSMLPLRCAVWSGPVGQVTAAVCDQFGGKAGFSVVVGHRSCARSYRRTAARPVFVTDRARRGERNVAPGRSSPSRQTSLTTRMDFAGFDTTLVAVRIPLRSNGAIPCGPLGRDARDVA